MVDHLQSRVTPQRQYASHVKVRGTLSKIDVLMKKVRVNLINLESLLLSVLKIKSTVKEVCLVILSVQCDKWLLPP